MLASLGRVAAWPLTIARPAAALTIGTTRWLLSRPLSRPTRSLDLGGVDIPHHRRRAWATEGRAHIELREVEAERAAGYLEAARRRLLSLPGVDRVRALPAVGRVVVDYRPEAVEVDDLARALDGVEEDLGITDRGFGRHRPDHPADREPVTGSALALAADAGALALSAVGRGLRMPAVPFELDAAALLTVVSYVPWVRTALERRLDTPSLGIGLTVARAVTGGLGQSIDGPLVDIIHRSSLIGAAGARRRAWERLEEDLMTGQDSEAVDRLIPAERPGRLPHGPIERFALPSSIAAAGAAGIGTALRPDIDRAMSFLVAGAPKAARWGREAFSAHLGMHLAGRDVLVLDPESLEKLDRIDTLVVPDHLLLRQLGGSWDPAPFAPELISAARRAELEVWVATSDPARVTRLEVNGTVAPGGEAAEAVAAMQRRGRGVMVIAEGGEPMLAAADVGLGLRCADHPAPWEASMMAADADLVDGYLLMLAVAAAKVASRQSAHVALAGSGVAGLMALGGIHPGSLNRVMGTVNLSALVSHLNGGRLAVGVARAPLPEPPELRPFHAMSPEEVLSALNTSEQGLGEAEAARRLGPPSSTPPPPLALVRAVAEEMVNPLTPFLAAGAGLSAAAGSATDAVLVGGVMLLNALIGGTQRFRADRATATLLRQQRMLATAIREGDPVTVDVAELVAGDVVMVQAGEVVPADCRLLQAAALEVDESNLTGESLPVAKSALPCPAEAPVAERRSMLYSGTTVAAGLGIGVVVAVGRRTEAYRGLLLARTPPVSGVETRLESLTTMVTPASVLSGLGVLGSGLARSQPMADLLSAGVSMAVAAVPEGLPLLATAAQQAAARRLSKRGVIVRNSRAIEALGRVDVLCVDKTGTLTLGRIRVATVWDGEVGQPPEAVTGRRRRVLAAARAATPDDDHGRRLPHPTDRAIVHAVEEAGLHRVEEFAGWDKGEELPFEPRRGFHATVGWSGGHRRIFVKGAPEVLLTRCRTRWSNEHEVEPLSDAWKARISEEVDRLAAQGLRVLMVAERSQEPDQPLTEASVDSLTFVGLLGLKDPVRATSAEAIAHLRRAGVRVIMISGDHPVTTAGIAHELGLGNAGGLLTGPEIDRLGDHQLGERMGTVEVCARVTPAHKVRIVRVLQAQGKAVAMTGDGANDAPAIRLADVGIALGTRATDAARDASDLVVTDDRIETIVAAVVEGRALWASVRDATAILVGGNLGEITFTLAGSALTGLPPINTRQLLLVNLFTDVLPATAIAVSPPAELTPEDLLGEGPESSLGESLVRAILLRGATTTAGAGAGWISARLTGRGRRASTVALASLVGTELGQTLAIGRKSPLVVASGLASGALLAGVIQTPGVSRMFGCTPLGPLGWTQALASSAAATTGSVLLAPLLAEPDEGSRPGRFDRMVGWLSGRLG